MLRGDVQSLNLASVIQDLAANDKTGTIILEQKDRALHFWFDKGMLRLVGLGRGEGPSVLNALVAMGRITPEGIRDPGGHKRGETGALRRLVKEHGISREEIREALSFQMYEHICEAFLWQQAHYEFIEGDPSTEQFDVSQLEVDVRLPVDAVIMEALRRLDEWQETRKAIVPGTEILVPDAAQLPADADATTRRIFALLDGERSVRDLLDLTRLGPFTAFKSIAALMRCGAARPLTASESLERAQVHGRRGDWDPAIRLVTFGLDREPNNHALRELAAACFEALDKPRDAIAQYRRLAAAQSDDGEPDKAVETYRKVISLAPGDLHAHERVFDLLLLLGRKQDALAAAEEFAKAAKKAGLPDKVRDIYARLIDAFGEDEQLLESLAELERYLGDRKEAAELYQKILQLALKRGDDGAALDACRTILRLEPKRGDIQQLRDKLAHGALRKQRSRKRKLKVVLIALGVAAVVGLVVGYEGMARLELSGLRPKISEATVTGRLREALVLYDEFTSRWPLSFAVRETRPDRETIESLYVEEMHSDSKSLEDRGELVGAVFAAEEARKFARRADLVSRCKSRSEELAAKRATAEEKRTTDLRRLAMQIRDGRDPEASARLAAIRDPLAVPGLRGCLHDANLEVRRAAVSALGGIDGEPALRALLEALGDGSPFVRQLAAGQLAARTGQAFGEDRLAWDRWFRLRAAPAGPAAVLQATLQPERAGVRAEDPLSLEWRILNIGSAPAAIALAAPGAGISVFGPHGKPRKVAAPEGEPRDVQLSPGEFLGGTIDLRKLCSEMTAPGRYRIEWRVPMRISGEPHTLEAVAMTVEILP